MRHMHTIAISSTLLLSAALPALGSVVTVPTMNEDALITALSPSGLSIDSITIHNGMPGQIGTYSNFVLPPVTIHDGIVLSSGNVANLGPIPEASQPDYDPAWPPAQVNTQMYPEPDPGTTPEFDNYGLKAGNIENFYGAYDVSAITVEFTLDTDSQVKFDFVFGSVEFPYWTGSYTDAFLVFLDGTDPANQVCYDANGSAVQVGSSFSGLETTADVNSAFANPHGLIHHLTTTTEMLAKGTHFLTFEVGDVNDHILDSAVFIAKLRTGTGNPGTGESEDCPADLTGDDAVDGADLGALLANWNTSEDGDLNNDGIVDGADLGMLLGAWGPCQLPKP